MNKNILMVAASVIVLAGASSSIRAEGGALAQARGMVAEGAVSLDRGYENAASVSDAAAGPVSGISETPGGLPQSKPIELSWMPKAEARLKGEIK